MTLQNILKEKKGTIVDVRSPEEFMGGNVSGSLNIPLQTILDHVEEIKQMKETIIFCCASGNRIGQDAQYFKSMGIDLSGADAARNTSGTALKTLIAREKAIKFVANNKISGALNEEQLQKLDFEGGKLYNVGKDGKKTEISPEAREVPTTAAQVEKIALTPENIFPAVDTRQNYIDILLEWYNKSGLPKEFPQAITKLRTWYKAQDTFLNDSLTPDQLSSNINAIAKDSILTARPEYQKANTLATGNRYGELPTTEKLIDLIKVRAEEKAKEPEKKTQDTESKENSINNYATGGLVYASKGKLINFQPRGTDTVPAMLTPGEFVINRQSTAKYKPVLEAINSGNYNQGGIVRYLNNGGMIFPNYYDGGGMGSSTSAAFDFGAFMQNLAAKLISTIPEAIKQALQNTPTTTQTSSNGVSSIDSGVLDKLNQFTNRLKSVADTLAALQAIPSEIKITGKHDVNIIINGDSALNQLKPDLQELVLSQMKDKFQQLIDRNKDSGGLLKNMPLFP
jgi:rhodanese-related sulfurtransferase